MTLRRKKPWGQQKPPVGYKQDWSHPLSKGLVGHWLFNEGAGGKAFDIAKNNHGTLVNTPTKVAGKFGQALSFNGTSQYIDLGAPTLSATMTVSAWIRPSSFTTPGSIVTKGYDGTNTQWSLDTVASSGLIAFCTFSVYVSHGATSAVAVPLNKWSFVVGTYDGVTWKVYVNGLLSGSSVDIAPVVTTNKLEIGAVDSFGTPIQFFSGGIDDVRIYNRALSVGEIQTLYSTPFADIEAPKRRWQNGISTGLSIAASYDTATATGYTAAIQQNTSIAATYGTAAATGYTAGVDQPTGNIPNLIMNDLW